MCCELFLELTKNFLHQANACEYHPSSSISLSTPTFHKPTNLLLSTDLKCNLYIAFYFSEATEFNVTDSIIWLTGDISKDA